VIILATLWDWFLKFARSKGFLLFRNILSSLERLDFSASISDVMKGKLGRERQVMVLRGACF
jgi:hypothetical protein